MIKHEITQHILSDAVVMMRDTHRPFEEAITIAELLDSYQAISDFPSPDEQDLEKQLLDAHKLILAMYLTETEYAELVGIEYE